MRKFERVEAVAAPLDAPNVDTDQIIPARFLWRARADGYGALLFNDLRTDADGAARPDFVLNRPACQGASVLVADRNFGCGSSREHAVWALADAGFRVVIAPSFGDIFFNNSFKNGLLPVVLPEARCAELRAALARNPGAKLVVDLEAQTVTGPLGVNDGFGTDHFEVDAFRRQLLLSGMDDITFTLSQQDRIAAFEAGFKADMPWI
ncbi:MAG: 3-isopropylmalate dehydratase small subunit [Acetobacteraceae bacterium SCN 69-10]|nr:MAG: 3-isopropylmalate dehydratase small subunit [Acetobacteraceae bacterium SCN 69-10]